MAFALIPHLLALLATVIEPTGSAEQDTSTGPTRAQALHTQARAEYETYEYERAISLWTEAYRLLGQDPSHDGTRNAIVFNIAAARSRQFEIDGDVEHLKKARLLLVRYLDGFRANHGDGAEYEAEKSNVEPRIEKLSAKIEQAEQSAEPKRTEAPAPAPAPEQDERLLPTGSDSSDQRPPSKPSLPLTVSGAALAVVGLAGLGVSAAGLARGAASDLALEDLDTPVADIPSLRDQGRQGNVMAVAGGTAGGVLLVAGGVLVTVGLLRRRSSNRMSLRASTRHIGFQLSGRF